MEYYRCSNDNQRIYIKKDKVFSFFCIQSNGTLTLMSTINTRNTFIPTTIEEMYNLYPNNIEINILYKIHIKSKFYKELLDD